MCAHVRVSVQDHCACFDGALIATPLEKGTYPPQGPQPGYTGYNPSGYQPGYAPAHPGYAPAQPGYNQPPPSYYPQG